MRIKLNGVIVLCLSLVAAVCNKGEAKSVAGYGELYKGGGLALTLQEGGARLGKNNLDGTFEADGASYKLTIEKQVDGRLRLTTDAKTYTQAAPGSGGNSLAPGASAWDGTYTGEVRGATAKLSLKKSGNSLSGTLEVEGYSYPAKVKATLNGSNSATGKIIDGETGESLPVRIDLSKDAVAMSISGPNGIVRFDFVKGGERRVGRRTSGGGVRDMGEQRDPRLVGRWSHEQITMSGGDSLTTREEYILHPDGTLALGKARAVASFSGERYNEVEDTTSYWYGHADTGEGDNDEEIIGRWKTQGNILYIQEGGQWVPYARYYVEDGKLLLTYEDGSRKLFYRK